MPVTRTGSQQNKSLYTWMSLAPVKLWVEPLLVLMVMLPSRAQTELRWNSARAATPAVNQRRHSLSDPSPYLSCPLLSPQQLYRFAGSAGRAQLCHDKIRFRQVHIHQHMQLRRQNVQERPRPHSTMEAKASMGPTTYHTLTLRSLRRQRDRTTRGTLPCHTETCRSDTCCSSLRVQSGPQHLLDARDLRAASVSCRRVLEMSSGEVPVMPRPWANDHPARRRSLLESK
mmetsp:Transcript_44484/g.118124  ORF Transcript_44484/g.118124 Transcript_44484/m.118124 type:complete len:229 (+) Transcript_44484:830-1516(+)